MPNQISLVSKISITFIAVFQMWTVNRFSLNLIPGYKGKF